MTEFAALTEPDRHALLSTARELQNAPPDDAIRAALRGKNIAIVSAAPQDDGSRLFERAALELGAQVAHLRPGLEHATPAQVEHTALWLGRLYDAIECIDLPPRLVQQVGTSAGVPVFEAVSTEGHPTARLAERLDERRSAEDNRCAVLQAVLLTALA